MISLYMMLQGTGRFSEPVVILSFDRLDEDTVQPVESKSNLMAVARIQTGQLWKKNGTPDTYLVTRVYMEALSTIAVLRKSGSEGEALVRVRVERTPEGQTIPGFSPAQGEEKF